MRGEQAIFNLEIKKKKLSALYPLSFFLYSSINDLQRRKQVYSARKPRI